MITTESIPPATRKEQPGPLLLVSNRGPIEHYFDERGRIRRRAAGGGVAVALGSIAATETVDWIAAASSDADHALALSGAKVRFGAAGSRLHLVDLPAAVQEAHYSSFCNPLLWFIQHSLGEELQKREVAAEAVLSWWTGYVPANQHFADAVIAAIDRTDGQCRVMLQDYHLYLCPEMVRRARPYAVLQHFIHIPWPAPRAWSILPAVLVRQICTGLLANDCLVFQTEESLVNFIDTCRLHLARDVVIDERDRELEYGDHVTSLWWNPISLNVDELIGLARSEAVHEHERATAAPAGVQTIVRVDRLDPNKNVSRGFEAYEQLLSRRPDLLGRVRFLAYLVPSRTGIPEYETYRRQTLDVIDRINARFGREDWRPIQVFYEQNREQALAGLRAYDVLLVNSVADGMNLVAKEGPIINERQGVLILSRTVGAAGELKHGALLIEPGDVAATSRALEDALSMETAERSRRAGELRQTIRRHQLADWLRHQLTFLGSSRYLKLPTMVQ
jgi:trehalose 6-phosphate synthase